MLKKTEKTEEQKREDRICWIALIISVIISGASVLISFLRSGLI